MGSTPRETVRRHLCWRNGMRVHEIMSGPVVSADESTPLIDIARLMLDHQVGAVPIVDPSGRVSGIITESDFVGTRRFLSFSAERFSEVFGQLVDGNGVERAYQDARGLRVAEVMTEPVLTVGEDATVTALMQAMLDKGIRHVPVVRDGVPIGMVTRRDLLRAMLETDSPA
jgi:CBS domain-containing protein